MELDKKHLKRTALELFEEIKGKNPSSYEFEYDFDNDTIYVADGENETGKITDEGIEFDEPTHVVEGDELRVLSEYTKFLGNVVIFKTEMWDTQDDEPDSPHWIVGVPNSDYISKQITELIHINMCSTLFHINYPLSLRLRRVGWSTALWKVYIGLKSFYTIRILEATHQDLMTAKGWFGYTGSNNGPFIERSDLFDLKNNTILLLDDKTSGIELPTNISVVRRVNP